MEKIKSDLEVEVLDFVLDQFKQYQRFTVNEFYDKHRVFLKYFSINEIALDDIFYELTNQEILKKRSDEYHLTFKGSNFESFSKRKTEEIRKSYRNTIEKFIPWTIAALLLISNVYFGLSKSSQKAEIIDLQEQTYQQKQTIDSFKTVMGKLIISQD